MSKDNKVKQESVRRIIRSAEGNLVRPIETAKKHKKFVTLTNRPANERPFVVVRSASDDEQTEVAAPPAAKRIVRPAKRSENPVLSIIFPVEYTKEEVLAILLEYAMTDYTITGGENGCYCATRSDLQSIADRTTTSIKLNSDGVIAMIDANEYPVKRAETKDNLTLVAYEFDAKRFDKDAVNAWLVKNSVDSPQDSVENPSGDAFTVKRSEVAAETEVRRVELEEGVTAVVIRSEVCCVPDPFIAVVNEKSYGSYGWGHLDFNASMADREYSRVMDDAQYKLSEVLRQITMGCGLELDVRKQLVDRALAQYGEFVKQVIDALPRQVMLLVNRAADETKGSNTMTTAEQAAAAAAKNDTPVTRAEIAELITSGVAAAFAAQRTEAAPAAAAATEAAPAAAAATTAVEATRSEEGTGAAAAAPAAAAATTAAVAAPAAAEAASSISRADMETMLAQAVAPLNAKIEEMSNTVIVRSDKGDQRVAAQNVKRTEGEVFQGSILGTLKK